MSRNTGAGSAATVLLASAAVLFTSAAQAMEIQQYDTMAGPDQDAYIAALVIGAQKVLIDEGKSANAAKINKLFTETLPGDKTTVGLGEFDSNLDRARVADLENVAKTPNTQRMEVEDAFAVTMRANDIHLPDSFFTVAKDCKLKHPLSPAMAVTAPPQPAAVVAPTIASAVPLSVYESARSDPAKQTQLLNDAYSIAVARTVSGLRSPTFTDGKVRSPQRLENDRHVADVVDEIATHPTVAQSQSLIVMIEEYAAAQPNTKLADVISSFLLTEAKKQLSPAPTVTAPPPAATDDDPIGAGGFISPPSGNSPAK